MATIVFPKKKLLLIGPYPSPDGGVSIHIKRLVELLGTEFDILKIDESRQKKSQIYNLRSLRFIEYFRLVKKSDILHIHSGHYVLRLFHFCISKVLGKKLVVTIHAYEDEGKSFIEKKIDKLILSKSFRVIFVNREISEMFSLPNAFIKEAFLPPILSDESELPQSMVTWIKGKKNQGYLICSGNASRLDLCNNQDLYGLDLCIEAAHICKRSTIKIAFVFVVSDTTGVLKIDQYRKLIENYDIQDTFFLFDSSLSFINLILESDIILRPTNTDGDALTVREGLFLGKEVIASDVVDRPQGTYLFKNRDTVSLMESIKEVYGKLTDKTGATPTLNKNQQIGVSDYLDFYKTVLDT